MKNPCLTLLGRLILVGVFAGALPQMVMAGRDQPDNTKTQFATPLPVPPEIEIAVGGFCSASGSTSAAIMSTVPGPSLWTVNV